MESFNLGLSILDILFLIFCLYLLEILSSTLEVGIYFAKFLEWGVAKLIVGTERFCAAWTRCTVAENTCRMQKKTYKKCLECRKLQLLGNVQSLQQHSLLCRNFSFRRQGQKQLRSWYYYTKTLRYSSKIKQERVLSNSDISSIHCSLNQSAAKTYLA